MSLTFQRLKKQDLQLSTVLYEKIPKKELIQHLIQVRGEQFDLIDSWTETEMKLMRENHFRIQSNYGYQQLYVKYQ